MYQIDAREGTHVKNSGALLRRFGVIQDFMQRRGGVFRHLPVIGGLTWSDHFAVAERAALVPCKPDPFGLGDD